MLNVNEKEILMTKTRKRSYIFEETASSGNLLKSELGVFSAYTYTMCVVYFTKVCEIYRLTTLRTSYFREIYEGKITRCFLVTC